MKNRKITPRRQTKSKGEKVIHAITNRDRHKKKLRAVAASPAAGFNDMDKSLSSKIITGLFLILLLNIFAVAAIVIHGKYNNDNIQGVKTRETQRPVAQGKGSLDMIQSDMPKISKNQAYTWVEAGESYESIAMRLNCDPEELKRLNNNAPLKSGRTINTPTRKIKVESHELNSIGGGTNVTVHSDNGVTTIVDNQETQPEVKHVETVTTGKVHIFKKGETFWGLSQKYGVSVDAIQSANPTLKATAIRVGSKINIPAK